MWYNIVTTVCFDPLRNYSVTTRFNIKFFIFVHEVCVPPSWCSLQTAIIHLPIFHLLAYIMEAHCVLCGVRYEYLYIRQIFYVFGSVHRCSISIIVQRDATQNSQFIILQVHFTCFGCQPHLSSGVHKTVNTASGTTSLQRGLRPKATLEGGSCTKNMTSIGSCIYSFMYSLWWLSMTPETCRVNLQNNK